MNKAAGFFGLMVGGMLSACDPSHVAHIEVEVPTDVQLEIEEQLPMVLYYTAVRVSHTLESDDGIPIGVLCEAGDEAFMAEFEHFDIGGADEAELTAWLAPEEEPDFDCGAISLEDQEEYIIDPIETGPVPEDAPRGSVLVFTNPDDGGTNEHLEITIALPEASTLDETENNDQ